MSEKEILEAILQKLSEKSVPIQIDLWDVETIARVFKRSETQVRNRMICLPDFPKAIRLPAASGGRSRPLYRATEVLEWTRKYQDRH